MNVVKQSGIAGNHGENMENRYGNAENQGVNARNQGGTSVCQGGNAGNVGNGYGNAGSKVEIEKMNSHFLKSSFVFFANTTNK